MTLLQDERQVCDAIQQRRKRIRTAIDKLIAAESPDCEVDEVLQTVIESATAHLECVADADHAKRRLTRLISRLRAGERIDF